MQACLHHEEFGAELSRRVRHSSGEGFHCTSKTVLDKYFCDTPSLSHGLFAARRERKLWFSVLSLCGSVRMWESGRGCVGREGRGA